MKYQVAWDEPIGRITNHIRIKDGRRIKQFDRVECARRYLAIYLIKRKIASGTIFAVSDSDPDNIKRAGRVEIRNGTAYYVRNGKSRPIELG